ncbi:MAG TPA: hypothetical protein VFV67_16745 [Actinophytocola sp.]|uniref:hypothetical protein n=1 Tax=Actinophytocola sp. TaxID=1872138 RepID=UPI002DBB3FDC|nr:hypothetical protein [Actinophytocola sp.]HEU5472304.1 hypothetical protein [Actinophytocola sp.]
MAVISNVRLSASKPSNTSNLWKLEVLYDASFGSGEVGDRFRGTFEVWEDDDFFDDQVTSTPQGPQDFVATATKMKDLKLKTTIDGDFLDTELGAEEIYVIARLKSLDSLGVPDATATSAVMPIAP